MAGERTAVTQVLDLGAENTSTPGTLVAPNRRFQGMTFDGHVMSAAQMYRPQGGKFPVLEPLQKEWFEAGVKGAPVFNEIIYMLESVLGTNSAHAQILDGTTATGAYKWVYEPQAFSPDTVQTYTGEMGSSVRAHKFAYGTFTEFGIDHNRDKVDLSGKLLAKSIDNTNPALAGSPTLLALQPMTAGGWDVYMDPTFAALGTTKLARLFSGKFAMTNRFGPFFVVDSSNQSFTGMVEVVPTTSYTIVVEADAQGMSLLDQFRKGTTGFIRMRNTGLSIYTPRTVVDAVTTSGSPTLTSATAVFVSADVGKVVAATGITAGTTIASVTNATTAVMSANATATGSALSLTIGTTQTNLFTQDFAFKVGAVEQFSEQQGIYAIGFRLDVMYDAGWTKAIHTEVINTVAGTL